MTKLKFGQKRYLVFSLVWSYLILYKTAKIGIFFNKMAIVG